MAQIAIHAQFEAAAEAKLEKLAKRAAKYGQVIRWTKAPRDEIVKRKYQWAGKAHVVEQVVPWLDYEIEGDAPRVGEFEFMAELERVGDGVIVAGQELDGFGRDWAGECQHCGKNRARKLGYVVKGPEGLKIVGKACLRDYMGVDVPAGALAIFQYLKDAAGMGDDEGGDAWGRGGWRQQDTLEVLCAARAAIRLYGWKPAGMNEANATADDVRLVLNSGYIRSDERRKRREALRAELEERADEYLVTAAAVMDWAAGLEARGDYERNMKVAVAAPCVVDKTFNLVVSAAAAFDRAQAPSPRAKVDDAPKADKPAPVSKWFGAIGQRVEAELEMVRVIQMPGNAFGPCVLNIMKAPGGELIKWFTGRAVRLDPGAKFKAKFTVKAQKEYKEQKETQVARLAMIEGKAK